MVAQSGRSGRRVAAQGDSHVEPSQAGAGRRGEDIHRSVAADLWRSARGAAGAVTLTLETGQALRLVKGRAGASDKRATIGLIGFAGLLRPIWHGARGDDPYADWWLIKVHEALERAEQALRCTRRGLRAAGSLRGGRGEPGGIDPPGAHPLRFANPYAYRGAHLVGDYDRLVRAVLTAQHIGAMTREDAEQAVQLGGRPLRRAFLSPLGYRLSGVTRRDLAQGSALSLEVRGRLGEVPEDILSGERRAPYAPLRPAPSSTLAGQIGLQPRAAKA